MADPTINHPFDTPLLGIVKECVYRTSCGWWISIIGKNPEKLVYNGIYGEYTSVYHISHKMSQVFMKKYWTIFSSWLNGERLHPNIISLVNPRYHCSWSDLSSLNINIRLSPWYSPLHFHLVTLYPIESHSLTIIPISIIIYPIYTEEYIYIYIYILWWLYMYIHLLTANIHHVPSL